MESFEKIAGRLRLDSTEAVMEHVEAFLVAAQVYLASLEDAIAAENFETIRSEAHKIAKEASRLGLASLTEHTEAIELLATVRRKGACEPHFEALRERLYTLHKAFVSESEMLAR